MSRSLEARLAVTTFLAALAVLVVLSAVVFQGVRSALVRQLDESLSAEMGLMVALVDLEDGALHLDVEDLDRLHSPPFPENKFLEIRTDARIAYRSPSQIGALPAGPEPDEEIEHTWSRLADGRRVRMAVQRYEPEPDDEDEEDEESGAEETAEPDDPAGSGDPVEVVLVLARTDESVSSVLSELLLWLLGSGLVLGILAFLLSRRLARRGLSPLQGFASRISALDDRSLSSRLDTAGAPDEVAPVGARLNELLEKLEAAFERERGFSADLAHELRTPLATLRSTVELALERPRNSEDHVVSLKEIRDVTNSLQTLVDRLLWLVRLDAREVALEKQPMCVESLLRQQWEPLADQASARRLRDRWAAPEDSTVVSDPMLVGIAFRNALENAVAYADEGGEVVIDVHREYSGVRVEISNTGSHVPQEDVPELLRRFTRGDEARTPVGSRTGLGLALVERVCGVLGIECTIRTSRGGTFLLEFALPAS